ncbi:hypothetical protein V8B97DRAFT_1982907, partial [Scleroderma yunnanense]
VVKVLVSVYGGRSVRCTFNKRDHFVHLNILVEPAGENKASEEPCTWITSHRRPCE